MGELVDVRTGEILRRDDDAIEIGRLFQKSAMSQVESVRALHECGSRLSDKKNEVPHGGWLQWVDSQKDVLGFGEWKARRLMQFSKRWSTTDLIDLTPDSAIQISRQIWGNTPSDPQIENEPEASSVLMGRVSDLETVPHKFGTIYADPPWLYGNQATRAATSNHYGGMTIEEMCAMPVEQIAADNAHLHMWTTNGFLFEAKRVMESWGFEYKSCFVWTKPQMGIGNYWRVSHEFMLLGVRGSCPFQDHSLMSWMLHDRSHHSAKPERVRDMIEKASPGPRIELFARRTAPGWVSWGNEIEHSLFEKQVAAL